MKSFYLLAWVFCFSAFAKAQSNTLTQSSVQEIETSINQGEAAKVGDVIIIFDELIEDSRCPKNTSCIWAGQAKVQLLVKEPKKKTYPLILTLNPGAEGPKLICQRETYGVQLDKVLPYPDGLKKKPSEVFIIVSKRKELNLKDAKEKGDH